MRRQTICFIMPGPDRGPIGGYKVIYEHANRFAQNNWRVVIVYPVYLERCPDDRLAKRIFTHPRSTAIEVFSGIRSIKRWENRTTRWFELSPLVEEWNVLTLTKSLERKLPKDTHFVSTFAWTASILDGFSSSRKYQFVQDFESWGGTSASEIYSIYKLRMRKLAISKWLCDEIEKTGEKVYYVPNGLDFNYFKLTNPIQGRVATEISMLWHADRRKRTEDVLNALNIVHEIHPETHVTAFGAYPTPNNLPPWVTYVYRPDKEKHNEIYNKAAIFVAASEREGWGLTPCEAMICGAAVACTDAGGFKTFAHDGKTALLSPVGDVMALSRNICRLIEHDDLRHSIATNAASNIRQYTWERSFEAFQRSLYSD